MLAGRWHCVRSCYIHIFSDINIYLLFLLTVVFIFQFWMDGSMYQYQF